MRDLTERLVPKSMSVVPAAVWAGEQLMHETQPPYQVAPQPIPPAQYNPNFRRGPAQPTSVIIERMMQDQSSFIAGQQRGES